MVNSDLIEFIESTPDTLITLTTGKKVIVSESMDEVLKMIIEYKRTIQSVTSIEKPAARPKLSKDRHRWISRR